MIAIIADDLTGAAEVSGVCLRYGLTVGFGVNALPGEKADAWVIATDSRSADSKTAGTINRTVTLALKDAGISDIFKKTDSVIRGHLVDELAEIMDAWECDNVLLQPSNPSAGRCITGGIYMISGVPLDKTSFACDPEFPAVSSSVEELLRIRSERQIPVITGKFSNDFSGINVPDCTSESSMRKDLSKSLKGRIYAGSAAFLAAYLEVIHGLKIKPNKVEFSLKSNNSFMVCGSTHEYSREYRRQAAVKGIPLCSFPEYLLGKSANEKDIEDWAVGIMPFFGKNRLMILTLGDNIVAFENSALILRERMAFVTSLILKRCIVRELFVEGGATAFAILARQGWKYLLPLQELAPGVVRMKVAQQDVYITVKPGSYSWPDFLINVK